MQRLPVGLMPLASDPPATAGEWWDIVFETPVRIAIAVVAGAIILAILRWIITRWVDHIIGGTPFLRRVPFFRRLAKTQVGTVLIRETPLMSSRRVQRTKTLGTVLRSLAAILVWGTVVFMIMTELGLNVSALVASAGIIGVAFGFGAQSLVKDFISGIFMLLEDQYGIGDVVDIGHATGVVEGVDLRITRVRDANGTLWYVRNGEIARVGNKSQGWANAVIDIKIGYDQSVGRAEELLLQAARELREDIEFADTILSDGEVSGVEDITAEAVTLRLLMRTIPSSQWEVARALRRRIRELFQEEGLTLA